MTDALVAFIEENINQIEKGDLVDVFLNAFDNLQNYETAMLVDALKQIDIECDNAIYETLKTLLSNSSALRKSTKIPLGAYVDHYPRYGYDRSEFKKLIIRAIEEIYPNKTIIVDKDHIERVVDRT